MRKILAFAAIAEIVTGFVLVIDPATALALLVGQNSFAEGMPLARVFGIALLGLGVACWPGGRRVEKCSASFRAMLLYNALVALYLLYLSATGSWRGQLLGPAVALHALVSVLLVWKWRAGRKQAA